MNRLAHQTSPYLLQHADDPVAWQPWGEEAIARARAEDRPLLLSIGYSSCHWCHVMGRESFADHATALVMNARFVNIKVDREERPDLDSVYQLAHRILNGHGGGWPLTAFLDAETLLPFFSGTYFPRQPRYALPGFRDLLLRLADGYAANRARVAAEGRKLAGTLAAMEATSPAAETNDAQLRKAARDGLGRLYDANGGGFGREPKFPMPTAVEWLLRHWARSKAAIAKPASARLRLVSGGGGGPDQDALDMVLTTLTKMARGGIVDHLGGGFFRYAVDRRWAIPHFEKMLGDNGMLLALYADALRLGPDALFRDAARGTAAWIAREMQHPEGGYYAAQDADSAGEEGAFYVWRRDAVKRLLTDDEHLVAETLYGLDKPANFEGKWHLRRCDAWPAVMERLYLAPERGAALLASANAKMFAARAGRARPATDRKVLAGWNGLAIRGMANAGVSLDESAWVDSAARAARFARAHLVEDGRLRAVWTDGAVGPAALLDDHAHLLVGVLALLQARWCDEDFAFARFLADELRARFEDERAGGFFFTPHDHERLIHRPKPTDDEALPAGNATAISALAALGHLAAEPRYLEAAERAAGWARGLAERHPHRNCSLLTAMEGVARPPELVIVRGPEPACAEWLRVARAGYQPGRAVYAVPYDAERAPAHLPRLAPAEDRERAVAFLCRGLACSPPIRDLDEFKKAMA